MSKWLPGQSGNPKGRPKRENCFTDALRGSGTAQELAELAWAAARKGESWAIQLIFSRVEPLPSLLKLTHEVEHGQQLDYTKLTDTEIEQLESLLGRATSSDPQIESGEGAAPAP